MASASRSLVDTTRLSYVDYFTLHARGAALNLSNLSLILLWNLYSNLVNTSLHLRLAPLMPAPVACHAPLHLPLVGRVAPRSLHLSHRQPWHELQAASWLHRRRSPASGLHVYAEEHDPLTCTTPIEASGHEYSVHLYVHVQPRERETA